MNSLIEHGTQNAHVLSERRFKLSAERKKQNENVDLSEAETSHSTSFAFAVFALFNKRKQASQVLRTLLHLPRRRRGLPRAGLQPHG